VLTAAVGISAGVGALVSAVQALQSQILSLCLAILFVIPVISLRGVGQESFRQLQIRSIRELELQADAECVPIEPHRTVVAPEIHPTEIPSARGRSQQARMQICA
jgi:hypothetical protein